MANSKTIIIAIPLIIAVIAVGIVFGLNAESLQNPILENSELNKEFETKDVEIHDSKDPTLEGDASLNETKKIPFEFVGEVTSHSSQKIIETIEDDALLHKTVPSNYTFGNFFDNGLLLSNTWDELNNLDSIHSIRFTNKQTGEINAITLNLLTYSPNAVIVGIQKDNGTGYPTGDWHNESSFVKQVLQPSQNNYYFELPQAFQVFKDEIYHIVVKLDTTYENQIDEKSGNLENGSPIMIIHYQKNTPYQPFNHEDPDTYWSDPAINSLHYDGTNWKKLDKWPMYLLDYVDGTVDGQPYTLMANWVIQENRPIGQTIIPNSDYSVSKFGFVVSQEGNPSDDLYYGVTDLKNNLLADGTFAKSGDLSKSPSFVEISFNEPINLQAGNLYRFYVYSPVFGGEDHYNLFGHEFSMDQKVGYGGETHRLSTSSDFENWGPWYDADAVFSLTSGK